MIKGIDFDKLNYLTCGAGLTRPEAVWHYALEQIEYLNTHNKNLTKAQSAAVYNLKAIIDSIIEA